MTVSFWHFMRNLRVHVRRMASEVNWEERTHRTSFMFAVFVLVQLWRVWVSRLRMW